METDKSMGVKPPDLEGNCNQLEIVTEQPPNRPTTGRTDRLIGKFHLH